MTVPEALRDLKEALLAHKAAIAWVNAAAAKLEAAVALERVKTGSVGPHPTSKQGE